MTLAHLKTAEPRPAWTPEHSTRLDEGLKLLALNASNLQITQMRAYGELLLKWNRTYNLLGANSAEGLVQDHLLDSLSILPAIMRWLPAPNASLLDVGSGAGLPGMILAIMLEDLQVTLVEPNGKKAAFLRQAIAHCNLGKTTVAECRIEDLHRWKARGSEGLENSPGTPTQHFICRAFTSLTRFATLCRSQLSDGSLLFAMKAARVGDELSQLERWITVLAVEPLQSVGKDVQRNLVVMRSADSRPAQALNHAGPQDGSASGGVLGNHSDDR